MANLTVPGASILTMPLPDSKAAPEKFKGRSSKIQSFLNHFEMLLAQNNVLEDSDKCELVKRYCSPAVSEFIQALASYTDNIWDSLKADLLKYYAADLAVTRYRVKDLVRLTDVYRAKKLRSPRGWREYGREFITIGGWLLKHGRISEEEYAGFYWRGIPDRIAEKAEDRLLAMDTTHSLSSAFGVSDVNDVVENLLKRDRFDSHLPGTHDDEESDMEREDDESDEESDAVQRNRRKLKKRARVAREKIGKYDTDDDSSDDLPPRRHKIKNSPPKKKEGNELEGMIRQLNSMTINDPGYAGLVLRALKEDPEILREVRAPTYLARAPENRPPPMMRPPTLFNHQAPPHMASYGPPPRNYIGRPSSGFACYGCGNPDHRMSECPELDDMLRRGMIRKDGRGRFVHASGMSIRRVDGEPMTITVKRDLALKESELPPSSHLIRVMEVSEAEEEEQGTYYYDNDSSSTSSDEEKLEELISAAALGYDHHDPRLFEMKTYPVTRSGRKTTETRKESMDSVLIPRRKKPERREPRPTEIPPENGGIRGRATRGRPNPAPPPEAPVQVQIPVPIGRSITKVPPAPDRSKKPPQNLPEKQQVPVDTRAPAYDGKNDDVIMEDAEKESRGKKNTEKSAGRSKEPRAQLPDSTRLATPNKEGTKENKRPAQIRRSEIAIRSDPGIILERIFDEGITVSVGDLLALSKELSGHMIDKIKPKTSRPPVPLEAQMPLVNRIAHMPIARPFYHKERGMLIELHMQCNNMPVVAIIDTGSQLNIIRKDLSDSVILQPIDIEAQTKMGDANGHSETLKGFVGDVPLNCGEVFTGADLWIGTHVPFPLLLGRPWQRNNYVSIDERRNGTYLIFKDPDSPTLEPRWEILVAMDKNPPPEFRQLGKVPVWKTVEMPVSFHIQTGAEFDRMGPSIKSAGPTNSKLEHDCLIGSSGSSAMPSSCHNQTLTHREASILQDKLGAFEMRLLLMNSTILGILDDIKLRTQDLNNSPQSYCNLSQVMGDTAFYPTQEIPGHAVTPLGSQRLYRLDSELLAASLGDIPFLQRTHNIRPYILSAKNGVFLGNSTDPAGHLHSDYLFLQSGLFDLAIHPPAVSFNSAFVRLFHDLSEGPPKPWLLPYLTRPPLSDPPVSIHASNRDTESQDLQPLPEQILTPISEHSPPMSPPVPTAARPSTDADSMPQDTSDCANCERATCGACQQHKRPSKRRKVSIPDFADVSGSSSTDSEDDNADLATSLSSSSDKPKLRDDTPWPSPPPSSQTSSMPKSSPHRTTSSAIHEDEAGSEKEGMEMDPGVDWERLREDMRRELEERGLVTTQRAGTNTYDRLFNSYTEVHGVIPSDDTMESLQNTWRYFSTKAPVDFVPQRYLTIKNDKGTHIFPNSMTPVEAERALARKRYLGSQKGKLPPSPLRNSFTYLDYDVDEPPANVWFMTEAPSSGAETSALSPEKEVIGASDSVKTAANLQPATADDPPSDPDSDDEDAYSPPESFTISCIIPEGELERIFAQHGPFSGNNPDGSNSNTEDSIPQIFIFDTGSYAEGDTRPNSPVQEDERRNRFARSRRVGRDEIIRNLQIEVDALHCLQDQAPDLSDLEKQIYERRLIEAMERLKKLKEARVGKLNPMLVFLVGLIKVLDSLDEVDAVIADQPAYSTSSEPRNDPAISATDNSTPAPAAAATTEPLSPSAFQTTAEPSFPSSDSGIPPLDDSEPPAYNQPTFIPQCPCQPINLVDPRTIPIESRPWFRGGDQGWVKEAGTLESPVLVDTRSLTVVRDGTHVPPQRLRYFSQLSKPLSPLIFAGRLAPLFDHPRDTPQSTATNYKERVRELMEYRREVERIYQWTYRLLSREQANECLRQYVSVYRRVNPTSNQLFPVKVDRLYFFQRLHPSWNPILKPIEAAFFRGAIYAFYSSGRHEEAHKLEDLLRTPHYDDWEVRELTALGALDSESREDEALEYFRRIDNEHWDYHAEQANGRTNSRSMDAHEDGEIGEHRTEAFVDAW